ncbi:hypothetical protein CFP56_032206 [Quercus suber]|uniref:Uncharacterized protein n=1 Tax=Quercus suber TaxID=58331 RepID=A0AAW0JI90_QUESU
MEGKHGPVAVTLAYGALTCAGEALATLLFSTLLKTQLFTPPVLSGLRFSNGKAFLAETGEVI